MNWQSSKDYTEFKLSDLSVRVLHYCFVIDKPDTVIGDSKLGLRFDCIKRFHQKKKRFHSCQKIESIFHELAAHYNKQATAYNIRQQLRLELPAVCDSFEWNSDSSAPDMYTSPILFRPVPPDSPVGLDFDHGKAIVGLAILSESDLMEMYQEMERKFTQLSEVLVLDLQVRDKYATELNVKNKFISAMLKVQSLRHSMSGYGGENIRFRSKTDDKSIEKFLSSVFPYRPPEDNKWTVESLESLIILLNAIAEGSDTVPTLVADYLETEVLKEH